MMSIKLIKVLRTGLLFGLLFFTSCLDQIELKIPRGFDETLIIQGVLIEGAPARFELTVTRLFDFTVESLTRVNVSEVILSDEAGNTVEIDRVGTGLYRTIFDGSQSVTIAAGQSYKVNVRTFDGRRYESSLEPLLNVPAIDSLQIKGIQKEFTYADGRTTVVDSLVRLSVNTPVRLLDTEEPVSLKWDLRRVYKVTDTPIESGVVPKTCYITDELGIATLKLFDARSLQNSRLDDYEIYDQLFDFSMGEGLYFEVIQSSLSSTAFTYFNQMRQILEREGNMFEAPAGKLVTNFVNTENPEEEVFGFFYATSTDTARIYVSPDFARHPAPACPPGTLVNPDGSCAAPTCCDCLSAENSTTTPPPFWTE